MNKVNEEIKNGCYIQKYSLYTLMRVKVFERYFFMRIKVLLIVQANDEPVQNELLGTSILSQ
ncbi:hypothetical protein VAE151_560538 [Vibrio aestuarianus]|nr:hypothetical protein VAE308_1051181 [Vibrio aestuarianus]CAH8206196.1 hypothetical protein VIBAE_A31777 [Vibrio aestuarianus subsp. francensis]CAH8206986.1 hypothetical protein VAE055_380533 [Vibrio aestuarianus]CAH8207032.1 hypothetical protein VAE032_271177 [Vibrio aestuarianus]CAH8207178.1 hypothetical protein VAE128_461183 [Vibrio aestuarianus]